MSSISWINCIDLFMQEQRLCRLLRVVVNSVKRWSNLFRFQSFIFQLRAFRAPKPTKSKLGKRRANGRAVGEASAANDKTTPPRAASPKLFEFLLNGNTNKV